MSNTTAILEKYGLANSTIAFDANGRVWTWYSVPNVRGTWDILWTCLTTTFLCTYTLLSLNIPSPNDTPFQIIRRKVRWMIIGVIGPEIVLTFAAGQWSRACHSVKAFHDSDYRGWSMRMAFFADMGGFVLQMQDGLVFPLNAKQLHWLVAQGHIQYPSVGEQDIRDKSKQDTLSKLVASVQAAYLIVSCVARASQGLSITTLELNTLAIVVCSLMTVLAWYHKPCDVHIPIVIETSATMDDVTAGQPWETTPLDHIDENGPGWSINVQPFMKMPVIPKERPIIAIPNDRFPMNPYGAQEYCVCVATLLFTGLHLVGWNFSFPSSQEQLLWRISSSILFGVTALFWLLETAASWTRLGRWRWLLSLLFRRSAMRNYRVEHTITEKPKRRRDQLPLPWEFWTIMPIAIMYGLARMYLLVEAFYGLRSLEATSLVTPQWALAFPHV